jgi:hypothetical protein
MECHIDFGFCDRQYINKARRGHLELAEGRALVWI